MVERIDDIVRFIARHFETFVVQKCLKNECMHSPHLLVLALSIYGLLKLVLILQLPLPTSPRSKGILKALSLDGVLL